jgi:hypothetical protein
VLAGVLIVLGRLLRTTPLAVAGYLVLVASVLLELYVRGRL